MTVKSSRRGMTPRRAVDCHYFPMALGEPPPTLPIWLEDDLMIELPLETSYEEVCRVLGMK